MNFKQTTQRFLFASYLLSSFNVATASSHWDASQVRRYIHNSDLQWRSTWQHLSKFSFEETDKILDIGSGDGRHSAFLSMLVRQGSVLGIDPNPNMVSWAKKQYVQEEYPNLNFKQGDYIKNDVDGSFDAITGFFSFHLIPIEDRDQAIKNLFEHLNPDGRIIMIIPPDAEQSNPKYFQAIGQTLSSDKWKTYFSSKKGSFHWETEDKIRERFEKLPFATVEVEYVSSQDPFVDKVEFVNWILGTFDFPQRVPENLRRELVEDVLDKYVELDPSALQDGAYYGKWGRYELFAKK